MKKNVEAILKWISFENRGRKNIIPNGVKYCPIITFPDNQVLETWSAEIIVNEINSKGESIVNLTFLSNDAPFELLIEKARFQLYEGGNKVADGVII